MKARSSIHTPAFSERLSTIGSPRRLIRRLALLTSTTLLAGFLSHSAALAANLTAAGQLLIDLHYSRGLDTTVGLVPGDTSVTNWANFGQLGGAFVQVNSSAYASGMGSAYTNPPFLSTLDGMAVPAAPGARMLVASFPTPAGLQGAGHYSIELWLWKNNTASDQRGVFAWTENGPATGDAGKFCAGDPVALHNNGKDLTWNGLPSSGAWHHAVLTYDGTTETIYLDGVAQNTAAKTLNVSAGVYYPMLFSGIVAASPAQTSFSFNGGIAALRVHSEALSATAVGDNFAAGMSAAPVVNVFVKSLAASAISRNTATLNGNLQITSDPASTALTFYYGSADKGKTTAGWDHTVTLAAPNNVGAFSAPASGLASSTTYYVRVHAVSSSGESWSDPVSFKTFGPPDVLNQAAVPSLPGQATLRATLNPNGFPTTVKVCWGATDGGTVLGNWNQVVDLGVQPQGTVSYPLTGLTPGVTYYFTFYASSEQGAVFAAPSRSFRTRNVPAIDNLFFSAITESLPDSGPTGPWAQYLPVGGAAFANQGNPTVASFGGVKWVRNYRDTAQTAFRAKDLSANAIIPCNGISIVTAVRPIYVNPGGEPRGELVDIFYDRLALAISHADGRIMVARNFWNDWGPALPEGQTTILSLVVQPDGSYIVYTNGVQAMTGTPNGSFSPSIVPSGGETFKRYVDIGRNDPDGWSAYNGYIGDVFVYTNALADGDRQSLESDLTQKFITAALVKYTITSSAGPNGAISPLGSVAVLEGTSQAYAITPAPGYVVADVLVDGVSVGRVTSYTFSAVALGHTISATFETVPPKTITASTGSGGTISPIGDVVVAGGTDQSFAMLPEAGFKIADVLVDGVSQGPVSSYTFRTVIAAHTVAVTFVALDRNLPRTDQLLFSAVTDAFVPGNDGDLTGNWPTYVPTGQSLATIATPTVMNLNGVKWEQNSYSDGDGYRYGASYWDAAGAHPIPCTGATIVVAAKPLRNGIGAPWISIVDLFYDRLVLGIKNDSGQVCVRCNGSVEVSSIIIPDGEATVLSLVVQPDGTYKVWTNGTEVMNITTTSDMTALVPGVTGGGMGGYGTFINVGRNNPDGWTTFNGNIGDVFVYKTALSEAERLQVESVVTGKFNPAPRLKASISVDPLTGAATISFNSVPGLWYRVEYVDALPAAPSDWLEAWPGLSPATDTTTTVVDDFAGASPHRFYRVVQVP